MKGDSVPLPPRGGAGAAIPRLAALGARLRLACTRGAGRAHCAGALAFGSRARTLPVGSYHWSSSGCDTSERALAPFDTVFARDRRPAEPPAPRSERAHPAGMAGGAVGGAAALPRAGRRWHPRRGPDGEQPRHRLAADLGAVLRLGRGARLRVRADASPDDDRRAGRAALAPPRRVPAPLDAAQRGELRDGRRTARAGAGQLRGRPDDRAGGRGRRRTRLHPRAGRSPSPATCSSSRCSWSRPCG